VKKTFYSLTSAILAHTLVCELAPPAQAASFECELELLSLNDAYFFDQFIMTYLKIVSATETGGLNPNELDDLARAESLFTVPQGRGSTRTRVRQALKQLESLLEERTRSTLEDRVVIEGRIRSELSHLAGQGKDAQEQLTQKTSDLSYPPMRKVGAIPTFTQMSERQGLVSVIPYWEMSRFRASPDGKWLVTREEKQGFFLWDSSNGKLVANYFRDEWPVWATYSHDSTHLILTTAEGWIRWIDLLSLQVVRESKLTDDAPLLWIIRATPSLDGKWLYFTWSRSFVPTHYRTCAWNLEQDLPDLKMSVRGILENTGNPTGTLLISDQGKLSSWNPLEGASEPLILRESNLAPSFIDTIPFSGHVLSRDAHANGLRTWSVLPRGQGLRPMSLIRNTLEGKNISFARSSTYASFARYRPPGISPSILDRWNYADDLLENYPLESEGLSDATAISPDGRYIAYSNIYGTVGIYDTQLKEVIGHVKVGVRQPPKYLEFSSDRKLLFVQVLNQTMIWETGIR
jgi:hypothetical protein